MSSAISAIDSVTNSLLNEITSYLSASKTDETASSSETSVGSSSTSDSAEVSPLIELLQQLQQLQETDSEKFTELMNQAAEQLREAASEETDSEQASILSDLADKFEAAAETGDLSSLVTPPPPPPGAYGEDSSSTTDSTGATATLQEKLLTLLQGTQSTNSEG